MSPRSRYGLLPADGSLAQGTAPALWSLQPPTGLPPTPEELAAFLADPAPDALA